MGRYVKANVRPARQEWQLGSGSEVMFGREATTYLTILTLTSPCLLAITADAFAPEPAVPK